MLRLLVPGSAEYEEALAARRIGQRVSAQELAVREEHRDLHAEGVLRRGPQEAAQIHPHRVSREVPHEENRLELIEADLGRRAAGWRRHVEGRTAGGEILTAPLDDPAVDQVSDDLVRSGHAPSVVRGAGKKAVAPGPSIIPFRRGPRD